MPESHPKVRVTFDMETAVYTRGALERYARDHNKWLDSARDQLTQESITLSETFVLRISQAAELIQAAIEGRH